MPPYRKPVPRRATSDTVVTLLRRGQLTSATTMASSVLADFTLNSPVVENGSHWSLLTGVAMFAACTTSRAVHALWWRYWPTVIVIDRSSRY